MKPKKEIAKVLGKNLPISRKHSIEIGRFIKGKSLDKTKTLLNNVIKKKEAVPFKKFNKDVPHRKGRIAAGRYPIKAVTEILNLLNSAYHNAVDKGMDAESLYIKTFIANKGEGEWHRGRKLGRKRKSTHIYIELSEKILKRRNKKEAKVEKPKKEAKVEKPKKEAKVEKPKKEAKVEKPKKEDKKGELKND